LLNLRVDIFAQFCSSIAICIFHNKVWQKMWDICYARLNHKIRYEILYFPLWCYINMKHANHKFKLSFARSNAYIAKFILLKEVDIFFYAISFILCFFCTYIMFILSIMLLKYEKYNIINIIKYKSLWHK